MPIIPFRVKIHKKREENITTFVWPSWWDRFYNRVNIISYEDTGAKGEVDEHAIGLAEGAIVEEMIKCGPEVTALDIETAEKLVKEWSSKDLPPGKAARSAKALIAEAEKEENEKKILKEA